MNVVPRPGRILNSTCPLRALLGHLRGTPPPPLVAAYERRSKDVETLLRKALSASNIPRAEAVSNFRHLVPLRDDRDRDRCQLQGQYQEPKHARPKLQKLQTISGTQPGLPPQTSVVPGRHTISTVCAQEPGFTVRQEAPPTRQSQQPRPASGKLPTTTAPPLRNLASGLVHSSPVLHGREFRIDYLGHRFIISEFHIQMDGVL
ncbi:hypothetical protein N7462_005442 [Penicillium macrosclerotiorum]|uniref:uncharacterized protein n=1 Tax=Penicillium macrosclerotiorum TaxID=303699 RepID=UPI002547D650|nr:uncharacterized protein N7462_005442 [Penicillium macrosclerotiorum]KAJ5682277.1 hypothetical protein N7462_005442 [Penicillium macrosclerotiorum]